ncbi:6-phosphogluconate phosphatase [Hartmannibacter diazotrophicus]|uniref:6-phosphogluconate phosphatase n=1 Tax=Hartmannibacter diazotrophicus TaxID=1482074 RepID=A0A2C9D2Y5_9HYPH|nr:HAD-IA family hydrolase [Hartmannibacter diazotrophicus]SON54672.1 6-phosphogluconate phosphatase [Hartmannibacter diazotrophicus]
MLIIFDCDGVLVDSETISAQVNADLFKEVGFEISIEEMNARFAGLTGAKIMEAVEEEIGRSLPEDFLARADAEIDRRIASVPAIEGAHELLDRLDDARCICSNSTSARLKLSLTSAKLYDRFKPYIFSAKEVGTKLSKPAPDVFLYAAREFDVDPRDVIVLEDSVHGVEGAVAAGMRVVGFTGGSHSWPGHADMLTDAGAETVVRRLVDAAPVIEAMKVWGGLDA